MRIDTEAAVLRLDGARDGAVAELSVGVKLNPSIARRRDRTASGQGKTSGVCLNDETGVGREINRLASEGNGIGREVDL